MFTYKLFMFEIQKCGQVLCAHKPYFLMPGHIYRGNTSSAVFHLSLVAIYNYVGELLNKTPVSQYQ